MKFSAIHAQKKAIAGIQPVAGQITFPLIHLEPRFTDRAIDCALLGDLVRGDQFHMKIPK
jgi:hypothetical protein